jgi:hypothetical protein
MLYPLSYGGGVVFANQHYKNEPHQRPECGPQLQTLHIAQSLIKPGQAAWGLGGVATMRPLFHSVWG